MVGWRSFSGIGELAGASSLDLSAAQCTRAMVRSRRDRQGRARTAARNVVKSSSDTSRHELHSTPFRSAGSAVRSIWVRFYSKTPHQPRAGQAMVIATSAYQRQALLASARTVMGGSYERRYRNGDVTRVVAYRRHRVPSRRSRSIAPGVDRRAIPFHAHGDRYRLFVASNDAAREPMTPPTFRACRFSAPFRSSFHPQVGALAPGGRCPPRRCHGFPDIRCRYRGPACRVALCVATPAWGCRDTSAVLHQRSADKS